MTRFACFLTFALSQLVALPSLAADKPNILFLFADDFTFDAIRACGTTDIDTPHLDRLYASGKVFTHAYNMGGWSGAVCVASRTMLNTGRYLWRARQIDPKQAGARRELWPQRMAAQGYRTFMTGKWHVSTDAAGCFDVTAHVRGGMPKDTPSNYNRPIIGQPDAWSPFDRSLGGFWEGGKHWSEVTADDAIGFLDQAKSLTQPFFMYIAFNAPHDPRQSPEEFVAKYPLKRIPLPASYQPEYPHKEEIGCGPSLRDERQAPFPRTEHAVKTHRSEYYALITHLDEQIGRVLEALRNSGQAERTWIFFTADHGLAVGKHGLMGKQNMHEHSLRVPFVVRAPGVASGKVSAPIYLQDVMATSLALAGDDLAGIEFRSLLPLIKGESQAATAAPVYGAYLDLQRAVIDDGWKLIAYPAAKVLRLFRVAEDPEELVDLADLPEHQGTMKTMLHKLVRTQKAMDDDLDLAAVFADRLQ